MSKYNYNIGKFVIPPPLLPIILIILFISGTTNPRVTWNMDNPLKGIPDPIPWNPDNTLKEIRNIVPKNTETVDKRVSRTNLDRHKHI